ncbi:tumor necrosis factor receptor superfamily member 5 isoform X5 [Grus americana]|uniref:tumor necrosis factor receptor superfamily member 5 isoform X5 n=1 Tax=Grus americana TaxID=9117 RepID=UPI002407A1FA|nr:tumor necrosis factor receptor superfamily member 5 isoform X5 [Grus americana]
MKCFGLLGLLGAALLLGCWEPGDAIRCLDRQYEHKGRCCNRCQPGEKLVSECSDTENSVCVHCESGHYQQSWTKERHCAPHDICEDNAGLIVKTQGNTTHNTVCECQVGMHCSDTSCQTCVENQPCQHGFGFVAAKALARMSSPCEPCAEGTFSNVSSKTEPCHPWTSCEEKGLVVKAKGTSTSDVICDPRRRVQEIEAVKPREILEAQQPVEVEEILPVQETLLRGQPVAQEDGKESRIAEQEKL